MAYKAENETRVTLADINKNKRGDVIRVSSVESSSGEKSYDIRNMYVTESGDLGFTSKGIRIKEDLIHDVIVSIMGYVTAKNSLLKS